LELATEIAYRMIDENKSLKGIEEDEDMPSMRTMIRWCIDHPEFNIVLAQARMLKADNYVDEAVPIADEAVEDVAQAARNRLRVQARLDAAAKLWPAKYSAKLNIGHTAALPQRLEREQTDIEIARRIAFVLHQSVKTMKGDPKLPPPVPRVPGSGSA
jgi:hypothetical protein